MLGHCILFTLKLFRLLIRKSYGLLSAIMGYPLLTLLHEKPDFILRYAHTNDFEFRERTGALVGNDNAGRAGAVLFSSCTKVLIFSASPKSLSISTLQIHVRLIYRKFTR